MITIAAIAINIFFLINGTFIDSVEFNFKGLVGLLLKEDAVVDYSYVTVETSTPGHSGHPNDFSVRWMQCCFFLFGQAMPLGLMVVLTIVWLIPLPLLRLQQLMVLAEVVNAWSALDVWCVVILASLLEIQQFAKFIVGDSCDGINKYLKQYLRAYLDGDNVCFDVEASLKEDAWYMYVASALPIFIGIPLIAVGNQSIKQRRLVLIDKYNNIVTHSMKSSDRSTASSIDNTDTTTTARTSRSLANQLCLNVTNDDDDDNSNNNNNGIHDLTQPLLNNVLDISLASSNFTDVSPNPDDDHYSLIRGNDVWENITLSRENSIVDNNSSNTDELSSSSQQHMQSIWSRCSFRNALLMSLRVMILTRMITVMYTPRSQSHNDHRSSSSSVSVSVNEIVDDKVAPIAVNYVDANGDDVDNGALRRHSSSSSHLEPAYHSVA